MANGTRGRGFGETCYTVADSSPPPVRRAWGDDLSPRCGATLPLKGEGGDSGDAGGGGRCGWRINAGGSVTCPYQEGVATSE